MSKIQGVGLACITPCTRRNEEVCEDAVSTLQVRNMRAWFCTREKDSNYLNHFKESIIERFPNHGVRS